MSELPWNKRPDWWSETSKELFKLFPTIHMECDEEELENYFMKKLREYGDQRIQALEAKLREREEEIEKLKHQVYELENQPSLMGDYNRLEKSHKQLQTKCKRYEVALEHIIKVFKLDSAERQKYSETKEGRLLLKLGDLLVDVAKQALNEKEG